MQNVFSLKLSVLQIYAQVCHFHLKPSVVDEAISGSTDLPLEEIKYHLLSMHISSLRFKILT